MMVIGVFLHDDVAQRVRPASSRSFRDREALEAMMAEVRRALAVAGRTVGDLVTFEDCPSECEQALQLFTERTRANGFDVLRIGMAWPARFRLHRHGDPVDRARTGTLLVIADVDG